jgi:hypothetical protein
MQEGVDIISDLANGDFDASVPNNQVAGNQGIQPDGTVPQNRGVDPAPQEPEVNEPIVSLRDQLTDAFKEPIDPATPSVDPAPIPQLTKDSDGRYRSIDGTFASQQDIDTFEAAQRQPAIADTQASTTDVLSGFTPLEQEQFKALPPELQQFVARTTQGLNERASRYGEYDMMEQVLAPRRASFAEDGVSAPIALANLFQLSDFAAKDPGQFILWYSQQRGIDLDELLDSVADQQGPVDPIVQSLQQQVQQLTTQVTQQTQEQTNTAHLERLKTVETVATEVDETGALKRPYFADLGDTILPFVDAARRATPDKPAAEILATAYDNACWANPVIRQKMQTALIPKPQNVPEEHAKRAKAAASSITGQPTGDPSSNPDNSNRSLREEIELQISRNS